MRNNLSLNEPKICNKDTVKVFVRVRPKLFSERMKDESITIKTDGRSIRIVDTERIFEGRYDRVFPQHYNQAEVYSHLEDSIPSILNGINSTIFAYGQTGSGKTFTMFGPNWEEGMLKSLSMNPNMFSPQITPKRLQDNQLEARKEPGTQGIIPRSIEHIFRQIHTEKQQGKGDYTIYVSFLQIYNEKIYDLLEDKGAKHPLIIREDKVSGIFVQGITEYVVNSIKDTIGILKKGEINRVTRQTRNNLWSSRSHTIFQISIENNKIDENGMLKRAKLNLCDLAGSEKIHMDAPVAPTPQWLTTMEGQSKITKKNIHFEELKNINLSLTTLGKVIAGLATNTPHIPFRESKITRLLQDSIGGNTKTYLVATICPTSDCSDESVSTLQFADRASKIKVEAKVNEINANDDAMVKKLQQEVQYLRNLLQLKRKGGFSDIHRQLIHLQEENHRLKSNTNLSEIEKLKQNNKAMRIEFQKIKEMLISEKNSSARFTAYDGMTSPVKYGTLSTSATNFSRNKKIDYNNLAENQKSLENFQDQTNPFKSVQNFQFSPNGSWKIATKMEQQRLKQLEMAGENLRTTMTEMNRCPICTLPIPCKHYASPDQMKLDSRKGSDNYIQAIDVEQINNQFISPYVGLNGTGPSTSTQPKPLHNPLVSVQNSMDHANTPFLHFSEVSPRIKGKDGSPNYNQTKHFPRKEYFSTTPIKKAAMSYLNSNGHSIMKQSGANRSLTNDSRSIYSRSHLSSQNQYNMFAQGNRETTIRIRKPDNTYDTIKGNVYGTNINQDYNSDLRKQEIKRATERIKLLKELELYREKKLQEEIAKLDDRKRQRPPEGALNRLREIHNRNQNVISNERKNYGGTLYKPQRKKSSLGGATNYPLAGNKDKFHYIKKHSAGGIIRPSKERANEKDALDQEIMEKYGKFFKTKPNVAYFYSQKALKPSPEVVDVNKQKLF